MLPGVSMTEAGWSSTQAMLGFAVAVDAGVAVGAVEAVGAVVGPGEAMGDNVAVGVPADEVCGGTAENVATTVGLATALQPEASSTARIEIPTSDVRI